MRFSFLLLLSILFLASCGDKEPEKEGNCMTAEINGVEFEATATTATAVSTTIEWNGELDQETETLTIIGTIASLTDDTETLTIIFACSELVSDLDYVQDGEQCGIGMTYQVINVLDPNSVVIVEAIDGSISITSLEEDKISGTFSFSGEGNDGNTYDITNGFFDTTINK